MFDWARQHRRTKILIYYRSVNTTNIFNIGFCPEALDVLRGKLNSSRFMPAPPEYAR